jgi:hypothetical protein
MLERRKGALGLSKWRSFERENVEECGRATATRRGGKAS